MSAGGGGGHRRKGAGRQRVARRGGAQEAPLGSAEKVCDDAAEAVARNNQLSA